VGGIQHKTDSSQPTANMGSDLLQVRMGGRCDPFGVRFATHFVHRLPDRIAALVVGTYLPASFSVARLYTQGVDL